MLIVNILGALLFLSFPTIQEIMEDLEQFKAGQNDDHKGDVWDRLFHMILFSIIASPLRTWGDNLLINIGVNFILSAGIFIFFFDYGLNLFRTPRKKWSYLGIGPNSAWTDRVLHDMNPYLLLFLRSLILTTSILIYIYVDY